jgi:hypothetical protein
MTDTQPTRTSSDWIYDGIFGPYSALPADFTPTPRIKPARSFDDLEPWLYDSVFTPCW